MLSLPFQKGRHSVSQSAYLSIYITFLNFFSFNSRHSIYVTSPEALPLLCGWCQRLLILYPFLLLFFVSPTFFSPTFFVLVNRVNRG